MKQTHHKGHDWDFYIVPVMEKVTDENGNTITVIKAMQERLRTHIDGERVEVIREKDKKGKVTYSTEIAGDKVDASGNEKAMFDDIDPVIDKGVDPPKEKPDEQTKEDIINQVVNDVTKKGK